MNRKHKIIISIVGIIIVILALLGFSYAYFYLYIKGNTNNKSVTVKTEQIELTYGDGNGVLSSGETLLPGDKVYFKDASGNTVDKKTFTVKNTGNQPAFYLVVIDNVKVTKTVNGVTQNVTYDSNDLRYTLTCTATSGTCGGADNRVFILEDNYVLVGNNIQPGVTQTYELTMEYIETGLDQSSDMKKFFEARINIQNNSDSENPYSYNTDSLAYNIINNAKLKKNGTELKATSDTSVAETISGQYEQVLSTTIDDYGTSYYYRGSVEDNYVNFAGKCWRVVRIEGDGSIKLILEDKDTTCNDASYTGNWKIATGNYGYTQGKVTNSSGQQSSGNKYVADYLNGQTGATNSMKTKLNTWYSNISSEETKLKEETWCIGDTTKGYDWSTGALLSNPTNDLMYINTAFRYETGKRLYGKGETKNATLKCNGTTFRSYIGTITADEVVYAGGKAGTDNQYYYLINNWQKDTSTNGYNYFWTLSPALFGGSYDSAFGVNYYGTVNNHGVNDSRGFRPAVSLKSGTTITSGDGTKNSPYTVS